MIIAHFTPGGAGLVQARFLLEGGAEIASGQFKSKEEVEFKMYLLNRKYMVEILIKWLRQRKHAMSHPLYKDYPLFLIKQLEWHKDVPFKDFVRLVRKNRTEFNYCTPGPKSIMYNHYKKEIMPWLNYCYGL